MVETADFGREDENSGFAHSFFDGSTGAMIDTLNYNGIPDITEGILLAPNSSNDYIVAQTVYDAAGRVCRTIDNVGRKSDTQYDAAGRTIRTIQNWVNGVVATTDTDRDVTVDYQYDSAGRLVTMTAYNAKGGSIESQVTRYLYESTVNASWQTGVIYPDTGDTVPQNPITRVWTVSSGTDHTTKTYDRLGRTVTSTDQRGVTHTYSYDYGTRLAADTVTNFGSSGTVDQSIRRIDTDYDGMGRVRYVTSYKYVSGDPANIVNQIKYEYDDWGNVACEFQEQNYVPQYGPTINGAVDESDSPFVAYTYGDGTGDVDAVWDSVEQLNVSKYLRLGTVTYPEYAASVLGRSVTNSYGDEGSTDYIMSRLAGVSTGAVEVHYKYLGLDRIVVEDHGMMEDGGDTGVKLSYLDSSGNLSRLDRFGRVVDQFWEQYYLDGDDEIFSGTEDRHTYTYDRGSNVTNRCNTQHSALDEAYRYDALNRLTAWYVGGSSTASQTWSLDSLGNDLTSGSYDVANQQSSGSSAYDDAGNMTTLASGGTATYDAWNRVATASDGYSPSTTYLYDGLNRRTQKILHDYSGSIGGHRYYYDTAGRIVEDRRVTTLNVSDYVEQYLWSQRYIDSPVVCLHDGDANGDLDHEYTEYGVSDWRTYYRTDANNVVTTAVRVDKYNEVVTIGTVGVNHYAYTPYGTATVYLQNWSNSGAPEVDCVLYAGYFFDYETGLYQVRARYYDASAGRFINRDPIGYQGGMNLYAYCGDNPINATDPMGTDSGSMSADTRSWWQRTKSWFSNVWNVDFVDENGNATSPNDSTATMLVRRAIHQNVKPIGSGAVNGVVGTVEFVAWDVPTFVYDNSLGVVINGVEQTGEANLQRLATLRAIGELLANWDTMPDYQAGRMFQELAAAAVTSTGTGIGAGKALSLLGRARNVSSVAGISAEQAAKLRQMLTEIPGVEDVRAFGSRTTGTSTAASDLDVLLIGDIDTQSAAAIDAMKAARSYARQIGIGPGKGGQYLDPTVFESLLHAENPANWRPLPNPADRVPKFKKM